MRPVCIVCTHTNALSHTLTHRHRHLLDSPVVGFNSRLFFCLTETAAARNKIKRKQTLSLALTLPLFDAKVYYVLFCFFFDNFHPPTQRIALAVQQQLKK